MEFLVRGNPAWKALNGCKALFVADGGPRGLVTVETVSSKPGIPAGTRVRLSREYLRPLGGQGAYSHNRTT